MSIVRFIGDVHGKFNRYERLIEDVPFSIQVGDMGVGFLRLREGMLTPSSNPPFDAMSKGRHLFIRGNHDNPEVCKRHKYYIPDGTLLDDKIFCLGGATSIDKAYRVEGIDWWRDEELSYEELDKLIVRYAELKPSVVCTHEAPQSIANEILAAFNKTKIGDSSNTRDALERMFYLHQPKYWVFGHWHQSMSFERNGTKFQCLNELESVDIDLEEFV